MILDAVFPPDPRVENEAITLITAGHQVFLFCLHYGDQKETELVDGIKIRRYLSNKLEYKLSALAYTFPFYTSLMSKKIKKFIVHNNIEALHVHDVQVAQAAFVANRKTNLPYVLDLHENRPEIMKFYAHLQKFPGKFLINPSVWKKREEEFCKKATKIVVVTQEAKQELTARTQINTEKVVVVPNTVRKSFFNNIDFKAEIVNKYQANFTLLYVGDTALRRGLKTVILALDKLRIVIPNIKLVIVGSSSSDKVLHALVKKLGLEKFVDFEGWQNVSLFPSYIKSSKICLSPLHQNLHHDTTYANKIFQYMSLEKPVLVSNVIAQKNIVECSISGLVYKDRDVDDFVTKTLELYKSESLQHQLGANGKNFIKEKFTWEKTSKGLVQMYTKLAK